MIPTLLLTRCQNMFQGSASDSTSTRVFQEVPDDIRYSLRMQVNLFPAELPIGCSYMGESRWTLLTTHRLFWMLDTPMNSVEWSQVSNLERTEDWFRLVRQGTIANINRLVVTTRSGQKFEIAVDPHAVSPIWGSVFVLIQVWKIR